MNHKLITVEVRNTIHAEEFNFFVSLKDVTGNKCETAVGFPGMPTESITLLTGDTFLYETPTNGTIEIRLMSNNGFSANYMVTQISPRLGISAGMSSSSYENRPFLADEKDKIKESLKSLIKITEDSNKYSHAQLDVIRKHIRQIEEASNKMGQKDWLLYTLGSLTGLSQSLALSDEARSTLFSAANSVFSWINENVYLLSQ